MQADLVPGESLLPGSIHARGEREGGREGEQNPVSLYSSSEGPGPAMRAPPWGLVTSQRLCLQTPAHWVLGLRRMNFRGHKYLVHNSRGILL